MSSKIIRRGSLGPEQAEPIQWRQHGPAIPMGSPAAAKAHAGHEKEPADPEYIEQVRAAAYQQGMAAGEGAGAQRAQARLEPVLASFANMVTELEGMRQKLRKEAEEAAVALALEVARRVLHREIATDPEAILGLVKAAFQSCDARETRRLRISPEDAATIRENMARMNLPPGLEVLADRNLVRGSAIFETSRGDLDASVDSQLAEIDRGLADVLKRRHP
jgi:flagellar assembly protein FliH